MARRHMLTRVQWARHRFIWRRADWKRVLLRTPGSVSLRENKPRELAYTDTHDQAKPDGQIKKKKTICARDWERMGSSQNTP